MKGESFGLFFCTGPRAGASSSEEEASEILLRTDRVGAWMVAGMSSSVVSPSSADVFVSNTLAAMCGYLLE